MAVIYPKIVLGLALILPLTLSFNLHKISTLYDIDDLIDKDFKTYSSLQSLNKDFESKNSMQLIVNAENGFTERELFEMGRWHAQWAAFSGYVLRANTVYELRSISEKNDYLGYPRIFKFSESDDERFIPNSDLLETPWVGLIYDKQFSKLIFEYQLRNTAVNDWGRPFDPSVAGEAYNKFKNNIESSGSGQIVYPAGNALFQWFMKKGYQEIDQLNLIVFFGLLFLFRLFWGSFLSTCLFFLTLIYTMWCTYIFMSLMGFPIDVLSSTVFLMLMVAAIEDFVYLSYLSYLQRNKYGDWKRPFIKILIPSFYTSLTTVVGFASLMVADLEIIKRFGLVVAFASIVEWFALFIFLTAFSSVFKSCRTWTRPSRVLVYLEDLISKAQVPKPKMSLLLLVFFPLAFIGSNNLNIDDSPIDLFAASHPLKQTHQHLLKTKGWAMTIDLLFEDFEDATKNKAILEQIKKMPEIKKIESPYDVLSFYTSKTSKKVETLVYDEVTEGGLFSRYKSGAKGRAVLYTDRSLISEVSILVSRIEQVCNKSCEPAGSLVSYSEFGKRVPKMLISSLSWCLGIVVTLLILLCLHRSISPLAVVLSAVWGPAFLLTMLLALDIRIYFVSSIFASVLVGLAGDNAIQFIFSSKRGGVDKGLRQLESSAFLVGICMLVIPCVFVLAPFAPLRELGAIFAFGTFASFFGDVWILNSLQSVRLPFFRQDG
jgi:predicted RND superfamily exporter protein